jgi:hypothetical protein
MNAESGEVLEQIVRRKELERQAGQGSFFWGIGNAVDFTDIEDGRPTIPVIFSKMLSPAKKIDRSPEAVVVWRKYIIGKDQLRELPKHVLITSRAHTAKGVKRRHFALICRSSEPLRIRKIGKFDPAAYRNVGGQNRQPGFSQVTALVSQVAPETNHTKYFIDMKADLVFPFVLQLADPKSLAEEQTLFPTERVTTLHWLKAVARIRL